MTAPDAPRHDPEREKDRKSDTYFLHREEDGTWTRVPFTPKPIPSEDEQRRIIEDYKKRGLLVFWHESGARSVSERAYASEMVPLFENGTVVRYRHISAFRDSDPEQMHEAREQPSK